MTPNQYRRFIAKTSNDLLSNNEVLIVKHIIENLDSIYSVKTEAIAQQAYISKTTVARLVKRLGFESYTDFRESISTDYQKLIAPEPAQRQLQQLPFDQETIDQTINQYQSYLTDFATKFDLATLDSLIEMLMNHRSVTIIGDYQAMEILNLLCLTLNMYHIPCYIFKQEKILIKHLASRTQSDLVLLIDNIQNHRHKWLTYSSGATIALITTIASKQSGEDISDFKLITNEDNFNLELLFLGMVIVYHITAWQRSNNND